MKPTTGRLLIGGVALLVALLCALWWSGRSSDPPAAVAPTSAARLQWRIGSAQRYDVRVDASMQMSAVGAGASQSVRVLMNGSLDTLTLDVSDEAALVGMHFSTVELEVAGNSDAETNRALAVPFRVRFSSSGMPVAFEFPAAVTGQHRVILENLVRTFQVTMQDGEEWVARESNVSGTYDAEYRRAASSVEKTKRNFVGHASVPIYSGADVSSTEAFRTDAAHDWLATMRVDETVRTTGQGGPALEITNHATLELRSTAQAGAAADADLWSFVAAEAPPAAELTAQTVSLSRGQALGRIRAEVAALDDALEGRTLLIHRLRDLLRVDGTLPAALLELMRTQELTDRTRADLYLAFELAGTDEAQAVLTSVFRDPAWSTRDAMRAIVALGSVTRPNPAAVAALWETAQSAPTSDDGRQLASTATFALGSLGSVMNAAEHPDYALLRARLLNGALSGGTAVERTNYTHAVGNTRDASLAPNVVVLLDDPEPEVRRAAALSLGMLDTDQVAEELLARFERESNSGVRGAIAESLVSWTAPTAAAVTAIRADVRVELDENTRYNMARFLSVNLAKFPESRPVLQDLLRTEQSRRIRQSVAEALAAPR